MVGLKATHGLIPYGGIVGIDSTFDHAGPMARSAADVALALEVIAGKDAADARMVEVPVKPYTEALGLGVKGLRIGVVSEGFGIAGSEPDVDETVRRALSVFGDLGASASNVSIPAHKEAPGIVWGLLGEGATAMLQSNGMGYHWQGRYNASLAETLGKARRAQAEDLPPTV